MAALVLKMSMSLDGYVASADGSGDWIGVGRSEESTAWVADAVANAGAYLMGAATYEVMAGYWPTAQGPFAGPMNAIPKIVFSSSLTSAEWGDTTIVAEDLSAAVERLKAERPDGYLLALGGARFARSLVATGLIDEYRFAVHPVILGSGERVFAEQLAVEPISTTVFSAGVVGQVFAARR